MLTQHLHAAKIQVQIHSGGSVRNRLYNFTDYSQTKSHGSRHASRMKKNNITYWMSQQESAEYLRVCTRTIRRMELAKVLIAHYPPRIGRKRFKRADLDALMEAA